MDEKNVAPAGQGPTSANCNAKDKVNNLIEKTEDSVIIYRSWFDCLKEQGMKQFAQAMVALLSFAFYGISIKSFGLSRKLETILETFTPIIETNRKKRKGGNKGAPFGNDGGRPPKNTDSETPKGLLNETPLGDETKTPLGPLYTVNGTETGKVTATVSVSETAEAHSSPHTNFEFFVPVFFFRNARNPERQARKFVEHYAPSDWKLSGGEYIATDERRIALAKRWEIRDDTCDRFKPEDLAMWEALYSIAPANIRALMLAGSVEFKRTEDKAIIGGPQAVSIWLESNLEVTKPIVNEWMQGRKYFYVTRDN